MGITDAIFGLEFTLYHSAVNLLICYSKNWKILSIKYLAVDLYSLSFVCFVLQLQVQLQSGLPQPELDISATMNGKDDMDEIDAALTDLQVSLEGSSLSSPGDITHIPELQDYLKFYKYVHSVPQVVQVCPLSTSSCTSVSIQ